MGINAPAETLESDYLIIGAGIAGLRAAIELAAHGSVLVVAKDSVRESSSEYAQGGIAAALSDEDEVELHEADTLAAGAGLCNREAVRVLVEEAPRAIQQLIEWGVAFDREGTRLLFGREGAHSRNRILHARGDSTGREIARTLYERAAASPSVRFLSFAAVIDLLMKDGLVTGALAVDTSCSTLVGLHARATLLATGGLGRVFRDTTNPDVATGDGVACAWRAGARLRDLEFVQFHPTALHLEGAPRFLLSEAMRGEGAVLRNVNGERFMERYHPLRDLAPRDEVSRAIVAEMERGAAPHVLLDLTHRGKGFVSQRFPRIYETCLRYGLDLEKRPAPVQPAAHYSMGGVATCLEGRASLAGLYAAGEVAGTGVHGANRLASNSLLEAVVFGARAARAMRERADEPIVAGAPPGPLGYPPLGEEEVRGLMTAGCGILRSAAGLESVLARLEGAAEAPAALFDRQQFELRSIAAAGRLVARCALARRESRGAHYRIDYPGSLDAFAKHSIFSQDMNEVYFE